MYVGEQTVLDVVVILGIMGILVLVSRGWGLTSRKLSGFSTNMFIALMIFFCLYLAFFLWGDLDVDPTSTSVRTILHCLQRLDADLIVYRRHNTRLLRESRI